MRITLIICTIACGVWSIWWGNLIVEKYEANMAEIDTLQTPAEIADKYMYDEYNDYWRNLDDVRRAGVDEDAPLMYVYEVDTVQRVGGEKYELNYNFVENAEYGISCHTVTGYPGTNIISWYHYPEKEITSIYCWVDVYGGDMKGWINEPFEIYYIDGQYYMCRDVKDTFIRLAEGRIAEIEEKTGLTMEEMVYLAYNAQDKLETLIYDVKEQAKVIEKRRMYRRLFILSIQPVCLIGMGIGFEIIMRKSRAKKGKEV